MEHSVAPYHLALPILKHLLSLPFAFSDLEFCDAELYKNLTWMKGNEGAGALGLDFTVTQESFGINQVVELMPGGKDTAVTDSNKEDFLKVRSSNVGKVSGGRMRNFEWNFCAFNIIIIR